MSTNDHFRLVQQVGGVANGSTWYDRTNYYETLPSHALELGLWLESDRMGFLLPALDREKLENQRQVVMNERRQRIDNQPYGLAFESLHRLLYPEPHPYHWPVIGFMDDIAAVSMDDVVEFFETWYGPDNAVVTVAGDVEVDRAFELVERWFGDIPLGTGKGAVSVPEVKTDGPVVEDLPDDVGLERLYLGYRGPACGDEDWYALDLLCVVLTGGRSSVLYHDLVWDRQLAQDVGAFALPTELESTVAVVSTARPEGAAATLDREVREAIGRAREEHLPEEEIERARNKRLTRHAGRMEQLDDRADLLAMGETYFGDPLRPFDDVGRYRELEAEDLRRAARRWLADERSVSVRVVPEGNGG